MVTCAISWIKYGIGNVVYLYDKPTNAHYKYAYSLVIFLGQHVSLTSVTIPGQYVSLISMTIIKVSYNNNTTTIQKYILKLLSVIIVTLIWKQNQWKSVLECWSTQNFPKFMFWSIWHTCHIPGLYPRCHPITFCTWQHLTHLIKCTIKCT